MTHLAVHTEAEVEVKAYRENIQEAEISTFLSTSKSQMYNKKE